MICFLGKRVECCPGKGVVEFSKWQVSVIVSHIGFKVIVGI
jgi:hypothetical protein